MERGIRPIHVAIVIGVGLLLYAPSLRLDFLIDDFFYLNAIEGRYPEFETDLSLFTFFPNQPEATARMAAEGVYPWWIDETIQSRICRPLSDLLMRTDHTLFGRSAPGYHIHSLVWWTAVLLSVRLVLKRALPGAAGLLALIIFALDEVHVIPVAWIANRNALISLVPVLLALWATIRLREENWRPGAYLAPLGIAVGLAGGELALSALGFCAAYELWGTAASGVRDRVRRLIPLAALVTAYVIIYRVLGFGGSGSGLYHHPLEDPASFLAGAVTRIPTLLAGGLVGLSADFWFIRPGTRPVLVLVGCLATIGLLFVLRRCWPDLEPAQRRALRWLLPGAALALVPIVATFPSDRMLLVPGLGLSAALAVVIVQGFRAWRARRRRWLAWVGAPLALGHLVLAPIFALLIQDFLIRQTRQLQELVRSPVVRESAGQETFLVAVPDYIVAIYLPLLIEHLDQPGPASWRPLSIAPCDHVLRRSGPRTLELATTGQGVMLRSLFEVLYRHPRRGFVTGDVIERGLLKVEILAGDQNGVTRAAFHFDRDLENESLRFLVWEEGRLQRLALPAVGQQTTITRTLGPAAF